MIYHDYMMRFCKLYIEVIGSLAPSLRKLYISNGRGIEMLVAIQLVYLRKLSSEKHLVL